MLGVHARLRAALFVSVLGFVLVVSLALASGAYARLVPTATVVDCQPGTVVAGGSSTCTATVTDQSPSPSTPTGTVVFTALTGSFDDRLCTLSGSGASASCQVIYTPSVPFFSTTVDMQARYAGDGSHDRSEGNTSVVVVIAGGGPPPMSKDRCKTGGWGDFRGFNNQGDCVSYVATQGQNGPSG